MDVTFDTTIAASTATSYVTLDYLKQFLFDEGLDDVAVGAISDNDYKRYANKATRFIDSNYMRSFPGYVQYEDSSLLWPRSNAYYLTGYSIDEDTIPKEVKDATCQTAYLMLSGEDLNGKIDKTGKIKSTRVKVDAIEEEIEYTEASSLYTDYFPIIDEILAKICGGSNDRYTLRLIRTGGESP